MAPGAQSSRPSKRSKSGRKSRSEAAGAGCEPTNDRRSRVAAGIDPIFIVLIAGAVGVLAIGVVAIWALWNASPAVLKHVTHVAGTLAPGLTFLSVFVAAIVTAIGWSVTRGIEREKREIANEAVRDLVRARLKRIWEVIREAVSSKKPYNPGSINYFLDEIQKNLLEGRHVCRILAQ